MGLEIEERSTAELAPYAANARLHSKEQIAQIAASIREFGFNVPCLVDDKGELIAGHGRLLAAKELNLETVPVIQLGHLSEAQAKAFRLADNQLALNADWDLKLLQAELKQLEETGFHVGVIGFDEEELARIAEGNLDDEGLLTEPANKSKLLELVNVTMGEPRHSVAFGDHYRLAGRHDLFCESVIAGHGKWMAALSEKKLFCPYAGVFVPFAKRAADHDLVMVQPDRFIAGHMLDRFEEAKGGRIEKK